MFSTEARSALLHELLEAARADDAIVAAAIVGSFARGQADRWSDIDLALRLEPGARAPELVAEEWTRRLRDLVVVVDTLDVRSAGALYRVFLLRDSLQVDLSFWPYETFRSNGEPIDLVFGEIAEGAADEAGDSADVLRWGWLYALHARAAIVRGKRWQALEMVNGLRGQVVALACARHGLPTADGRGVDLLPLDELGALGPTVPRSVDLEDLGRALAAGLLRLGVEAKHLDPDRAASLAPVLETLTSSLAARREDVSTP